MPTYSVKLYKARLLPGRVPPQRVATLLQLQHICRPSVFTITNTTTVKICLLVEWCCKMDACWVFATQSCMLAGVMLFYLPYLLVWCLTIHHACWCDAHYRPYLLMWCLNKGPDLCWCGPSALAMLSGVVSHYQPCLLVCCFNIGHAFWGGASLSTMPIGVLPHYRPCLLVRCLIINHACWCGSSL